jgi:hypothetical protein
MKVEVNNMRGKGPEWGDSTVHGDDNRLGKRQVDASDDRMELNHPGGHKGIIIKVGSCVDITIQRPSGPRSSDVH